jgi:ketosteroid isomerase-like protein
MTQQDPLEIIKNLTDAINRCDLDTALSLYEHEAVLIAQPNNTVQGRDAFAPLFRDSFH